MSELPVVSLFFGGPGDTDAELEVANASVRAFAASFRQRGLFDLQVWHWCGEDHPTVFHVREDIQDRIDENLHSSHANLFIAVFKERLGTPVQRGGKDYDSSTAYELQNALAGSEGHRPIIGVFQLKPPAEAKGERFIQAGQAPETRRVEAVAAANAWVAELARIDRYLDSLRQPEDRFGRMRFANIQVFRRQLNDFLARELEAIAQAIGSTSQSPTPERRTVRRAEPGFPFRGMQSMGYQDYDVFRGRDVALVGLRRRMEDPSIRFLCLTGPSGAGKSSMLKAGLLGGMVRATEDGSAFWLVDLHPDDNPFEKFEAALSSLWWCNAGEMIRQSPMQTHGLRRVLSDAAGQGLEAAQKVFDDHVGRPLRAAGPAEPPEIVVVIDQLEELWTKLGGSDDRRERFLTLIAAGARCPGVRILATLRSDVTPSFETATLVAEALMTGGAGVMEHIYPPVIPDELGAMIRETAQAGGISLGQDVIGALLRDAENVGSAALPLVAFTLSELVAQAHGGAITLDAYFGIGCLPGAIETTVKRHLAQYLPRTDDLQAELPALFSRLAGLREGPEVIPVRQTCCKRDLAAAGINTAIVDALVEARLLQIGDPAPDDIRLAHDALFQKWQALADWVAANRLDLAFRSVLLADASEWRRHGERPRYLKHNGEALEDAQARVANRPDLFSHEPLVDEYLRAAARRQDKATFINAINAGSPGEALKVWRKHQQDLGLDPFEDRGDNANQLRPGIYAAITGYDSPEVDPSKSSSADDGAPSDAEETGGPLPAEITARKVEPEPPSVYDDPEHRTFRAARGRGPMNYAAMFGRVDMLRKLVERGEKPKERPPGSFGLLGEAAYGGSAEAVRYLVEEHGFDVEEIDLRGATPMQWACQGGHEAIVDYLKGQGARLDHVTNPGGWTCLTEAAWGGHLDLVRRLIEDEGLDPHHLLDDGRTAFHRAAEGDNPGNLAVVQYLVERFGVDRSVTPTGGQSALMLAASQGSPDVLRFLLSQGFDVNDRDSSGQTPLHGACWLGRFPVADILLEVGDADLNAIDDLGYTPIAYAADRGRDTFVNRLLARGADPTISAPGGWPPLHTAAAAADVALLETLCDRAQADRLNVRNSAGWTAMMVAAQEDKAISVTALRRAGASPFLRNASPGQHTALHIAAIHGKIGAARALLDAPPAPRFVETLLGSSNRDGVTPLFVAARSGHLEMVRFLLEAGADPQGRPQGDARLAEAALLGTYDDCRRELANCESPNIRDAFGRTALFIAAEKNDVAICQLLLADPRIAVDARRWDEAQAVQDDITFEKRRTFGGSDLNG